MLQTFSTQRLVHEQRFCPGASTFGGRDVLFDKHKAHCGGSACLQHLRSVRRCSVPKPHVFLSRTMCRVPIELFLIDHFHMQFSKSRIPPCAHEPLPRTTDQNEMHQPNMVFTAVRHSAVGPFSQLQSRNELTLMHDIFLTVNVQFQRKPFNDSNWAGQQEVVKGTAAPLLTAVAAPCKAA